MSVARKGRGAAIGAVVAFAVLWTGSVYRLFTAENGDWFTGVLVLGIFGLGCPGLPGC